MSFLKRLYYYSSGFVIGIIFLLFIFNGKRASCNYGPSARVIDNILTKELTLESNIDNLNNSDLIEIISNGRVIFNKSEPNNKPCGKYYIESESMDLIIINCKNEAIIKIK